MYILIVAVTILVDALPQAVEGGCVTIELGVPNVENQRRVYTSKIDAVFKKLGGTLPANVADANMVRDPVFTGDVAILTKNIMLPMEAITVDDAVQAIVFNPEAKSVEIIIMEQCGVGGYGAIFRGIAEDDTSVALKFSMTKHGREALRTEASRMAVVSGTRGFPKFYSHGEFDFPFNAGVMAMEYFPNGDLQKRIEQNFVRFRSRAYRKLDDLMRAPHFPFRHPLRLSGSVKDRQVRQVGIAIDAFTKLHSLHTQHNMLHRDIKPQNILLDSDGMFVLADLGDGHSSTPEFFSERLMYGRAPSAADDYFAMMLTLLLNDGIMTPRMSSERLERTLLNGDVLRLRSVIRRNKGGMGMASMIRQWDANFRNHVLKMAATTSAHYKMWLDVWDLLKSAEFNYWANETPDPPSPHAKIMKLLQDELGRAR